MGFSPSAVADQEICAQVRVQIEQRLTVTRTAFRATLEIENESDSDFVEAVRVVLDIRDIEGMPANHLFNTSMLELENLSDVDGGGVVAPGVLARAVWTILPYREAALEEPVEYEFGATFSYIWGGELVTIPLVPERLTVYPDPFLEVKYFWERDVYADDPFTPETIEPSLPFSLGMMITNNGAGEARNLRITSGQPEIIENARGLLIAFQLLGTQVGTQNVSPSLTVNFGDLAPGGIAIARWIMTSTLQGQFIEYTAEYEHLTGLGDPRLSLIDSLSIYELIHVVRAAAPADDLLPDFLTNERSATSDPPDPFEDYVAPGHDTDPDRIDLPDTLHLSNGDVDFVTPVLDATIDPNFGGQFEAQLVADMPGGWAYVKVPDPFDGSLRLVRVERSDGSELVPEYSFWQTDRVFIEGGQQPIHNHYRIHLFDQSGDGVYALFFEPDTAGPGAIRWEVVSAHGAGDLQADLPLISQAPPHRFTEPRVAGVQRLRVSFDEPIKADTFNLVQVLGNLGPDGEQFDPNIPYTLSLNDARTRGEIVFSAPLPDYALYCIRLIGVTDAAGNALSGDSQLLVTALVGDATGDGRVNNTDVGAVVSLVGTDPIDPSNVLHIRSDINQDNVVDELDVDEILTRRGRLTGHFVSPCATGQNDGGLHKQIPGPVLRAPNGQ